MKFKVVLKKSFDHSFEIKTYVNIIFIDANTNLRIIALYDILLTWKESTVLINTPKKISQKIVDNEIIDYPSALIGIPDNVLVELENHLLKERKKILGS